MAQIVPSPPKVKEIKPQPNTGAPKGSSIAANMVKNSRGQNRAVAPKIPKPHQTPKPRAKVPYNPLNSPYGSEGQFEEGVRRQAKTEYDPKLAENSGEEADEKALTAQRQGDNVNIYNQYSQQAQASLAQAKTAMAEVAARQNSSTAAGQQALQAALSNTGVAGVSAVPNQDAFMNEAAGLGNEGSQTLAGEQTAGIDELAKDAALVPGAGLEEASNTEQQRDTGVLSKLSGERQKIIGEVPNFEAKARNELTKNEQERQANKLQNQLAQSKLGLENKTQNQGTALKKTELKVNTGLKEGELAQKTKEGNDADRLNTEKLAQEAGLESEKLVTEKEKIRAEIGKAKTAEQKAAAEIAGKRFDNGLQLMTNYLKPKNAYEYKAGETPEAIETAREKGGVPYQRNAQDLYNILTQQGNLTAPEAFRIMRSSGNGYVEQFANRHEKIYNNANKARNVETKIKAHPITPLRKGK